MKSNYGQKYSKMEWLLEAAVNESFFEDLALRGGKKSSPCGGGAASKVRADNAIEKC